MAIDNLGPLCTEEEALHEMLVRMENRQKVITRPQKRPGALLLGGAHLPPYIAWDNLAPRAIITLHNSWITKYWQKHIAPRCGLLLELMVGQLEVSPEVPSTISWRLGDTPGRVARDSYGPITWLTQGTHVPIAHPSQGTHVVPRHERVAIKRVVTMVDIGRPDHYTLSHRAPRPLLNHLIVHLNRDRGRQ